MVWMQIITGNQKFCLLSPSLFPQTILLQEHQRKGEKARVGGPVYPALQHIMEGEQHLCEGCFTFAVGRKQMQPYSFVPKKQGKQQCHSLRAVSVKITVLYFFCSDLLFETGRSSSEHGVEEWG